MQKKLFFILIFFSVNVFSQSEKLHYFIEKDSLLGVKNQNGKIIIPAKHTMIPSIYDGILNEKIKDDILLFWVLGEGFKAYDRNGNFLFEPYIFDSGADDFSEGLMRFTENKKVGLADRKGTKIIPAQYDWISSINFGFASYCQGCYFDRSKDEEHPPLVGGIWGYVDKNGNEIKPTEKRNHPKDFETEKHQFIPYQFHYNAKEKEILSFFEKRKDMISKIYNLECKGSNLYFEIIEKPSKSEPFYKIKTFEVCDQYWRGADETYDDYKTFKVSEDGKEFYTTYIELVDHKKYSEYVERKISVDKWIKKSFKADH